MALNFQTLTEDEFNGFISEAQEMKDKLTAQTTELSTAQQKLKAVEEERDRLAQEKEQTEKLQALTQKLAGLRSQADQALQDGKLTTAEYNEYFGKDLKDDMQKYAADPIELTIMERFVSKLENRPVNKSISLRGLGEPDPNAGNNSYQTMITPDNLVV